MARAIVFLSFLLLVVFPAAYAVTYPVGGSGSNGGWNTGINYDDWAGSITFTTSDSLVFTFDSSHTVDEVSEADYTSCNSNSPISSSARSPTTIALTTAGTRYFICPRSNHCAQGMKVAVTVTSGTTSPSPPSGTTPSPPSGGATPTPPSRGATPTPPSGTPAKSPPPPAGAATSLGGRNSFIVGSLFVFVAGLMG